MLQSPLLISAFLSASLLGSVFVTESVYAGATTSNDVNTAAAMPEGPDDGQRRQPRRPPQEAITACESSETGDACQFPGRNGESVQGTCWRPPNDGDLPLACRPNQRPSGPPDDRS